MAQRCTFKTSLQTGMTSVPVKAYVVHDSAAEISLSQFHSCGARIAQPPTCPECGPADAADVHKAYAPKGHEPIPISAEEIEQARVGDADKAIRIEGFVSSGVVRDVHSSGKYYFLAPDGPAAQRPYALLRYAMMAESRVAVGRVVISGRERLVSVASWGHLMLLTVLVPPDMVRSAAVCDGLVDPEIELSESEYAMARSVVNTHTMRGDAFAGLTDGYTSRMEDLIARKAPPIAAAAGGADVADMMRKAVAS